MFELPAHSPARGTIPRRSKGYFIQRVTRLVVDHRRITARGVYRNGGTKSSNGSAFDEATIIRMTQTEARAEYLSNPDFPVSDLHAVTGNYPKLSPLACETAIKCPTELLNLTGRDFFN